MEFFKLAIIHNELNGGDEKVEFVGCDVDSLHSEVLLDYASKNYSECKIFQKLNYRHNAELISFFFLKLFGDIVFLNTSRDGDLTGILLLPDQMPELQVKLLRKFLQKIRNFSIYLQADLNLVDGLLEGTEVFPIGREEPLQLVERFWQSHGLNTNLENEKPRKI